MKKLFLKLFRKKQEPLKVSMIQIYKGDIYAMHRMYEHLLNNPSIKVTSVSITYAPHDGGYKDNKYCMAISYDCYK